MMVNEYFWVWNCLLKQLFKLVLLYFLQAWYVQGAAERTPTFIYLWSFILSIDDESSLFRLFPVPYQLQF